MNYLIHVESITKASHRVATHKRQPTKPLGARPGHGVGMLVATPL